MQQPSSRDSTSNSISQSKRNPFWNRLWKSRISAVDDTPNQEATFASFNSAPTESELHPASSPSSGHEESLHGGSQTNLTDEDHDLLKWLPDRFHILGKLGQGTFGSVYLAHDHRLKREVAIKILRSEWMAVPSTKKRFLRESRAAARLNHPSIVRVLEADENAHCVWQVSDAIDGLSLADVLQQGRLQERTAASALSKIAEAVHCAHQSGIIHRDLKPSNILVPHSFRPNHEPVSIYLTDFGLAKIVDDNKEQTMSGMIVGTPRYMAPELFHRHGKDHPTSSIDIYALGVILFECLTGTSPFRNAETIVQHVISIQTEHPSPRQVCPHISRDLDVICQKAMHIQPEQRYASADDFSKDLACFLEGQPIRARSQSIAERAWRFAKAHQLVVTITSILFLSLLTITAISLNSQAKINAQNIELKRRGWEANQLRARELKVQQNFEDLSWRSGIQVAYQKWKDHHFAETRKSLQRLRESHPNAIERLEWKLLWAELHHQCRPLFKTDGGVEEIKAIPGTSKLVYVTDKGWLGIYDLKAEKIEYEFKSQVASLNALDLHPSKPLAYFGGGPDPNTKNSPLFAIDLETKMIVTLTDDFPTVIESICINDEATHVICGCRYEPVRVYDLATLQYQTYDSNRRHRWLASMSTEKSFLFLKTDHSIGSIQPFSASLDQEIQFPELKLGLINFVKARANSQDLLVQGVGRGPILLNLQSNTILAEFTGIDNANIRSIESSSNGRYVIAGTESGEIVVWDMVEIAIQRPSYIHNQQTTSHAVLKPIGQYIVSDSPIASICAIDETILCGSQSGEFCRVPLPSHSQLTVQDNNHPVYDDRKTFCYTDSGEQMFVRSNKNRVFVGSGFNHIHPNNQAVSIETIQHWYEHATQLHDGDRTLDTGIVPTNRDGVIWINNHEELETCVQRVQVKIAIPNLSEHFINLVDYDRGREEVILSLGRRLAFAPLFPSVSHTFFTSPQTRGRPTCVAFHPNPDKLLFGTDSNDVGELVRGTNTIRTIGSYPSNPKRMRYLRDQKRVLSSHEDGAIRITDFETKESKTISAHKSEIDQFVIDKNEEIGISVDRHNQLAVWRIPTAELIGILLHGVNNAAANEQTDNYLWMDSNNEQLLLVYVDGEAKIRRWNLRALSWKEEPMDR